MLALKRRAGESIRIGDDITVTVVDAAHGRATLAIEAPRAVPILRSELEDRQPRPEATTEPSRG